MPPLGREPNLFPAELFNADYLAQNEECKWTALYTQSRREKELMRRLHGMGISFYCPVVPQRKRAPSGRVRVSHIPLFSSYVFLYGDEMARYRALTTKCVVQTLAVTNTAEMTRQLQQIERLIESRRELKIHRRIQPGVRVRIRHGPLRGVEGMMLREHGDTRLLVAVDIVGQGASLAIDDADLEALE
jgi:transcriptional antiterminator RfaH